MTTPTASHTGRLLLVPNALDQGSADDGTASGAGLHLAFSFVSIRG